MLSVANVRSPSAAANYFAADNYYAKADADRSGQWLGKGAEALGLTGRVEAKAFDAVLRGELPDGTTIGNPGQSHRPGTDLTFSLPKSWSLLALVGKDARIIEAYREAVRETLGWAEKNAAETRLVENGQVRTVQTGNLMVALFQHDTNRNQEPNLHFHAVVANVTQGEDGKWRTLKNDRLWSLNTLLNSAVMARFRTSIEKLGYEAGPVGKHGNFEARGISREQVMAFSTRRQEVLDARRGTGLEAGRIAALATRSAKENVVDRGALSKAWQETAGSVGLDLGRLIGASHLRVAQIERSAARPQSLLDRGLGLMRDFAARLKGDVRDPLVPDHVLKRDAPTIAGAQAVASAVRHLSQREAAFGREALYKAALDFRLPTTIAHVERATRSLVRSGHLITGKGEHRGWLASRDALAIERSILTSVEEGKHMVEPGIEREEVERRVQASAQINHGFRLNDGQLDAAALMLTSSDRTVAVQGVAGAGKSSVLKPVAQVLGEQGKPVIGLAIQNTLVQMLERDTGIRSQTLARFLKGWERLLENSTNAGLQAEAKAELKDHVLILDEASMVSNADKEKLVRLANLAEMHRLVLMGDRKQLGAVDAGKPFALLQDAGIARAEMRINLRGRDPVLRRAQAAAQSGLVRSALDHLKDHTIEVEGDGAIVAAEKWLGLSPAEREKTAIYASGRAIRSAVNEAVQAGLRANGELGPGTMRIEVLDRINLTKEELRYLANYRPGQILDLQKTERAQKLKGGEYNVRAIDEKKGLVELEDRKGKRHRFNPLRMRANRKDDTLALFEKRDLQIYTGDTIRWTRNDHSRGLFNADRAKVISVENGQMTVETSKGEQLDIKKDDPMLKRIDLAYALNAHMAQGLTSDRGIAVMNSRERNLSNQKTFLVTVTRLRDHLILVVDSAGKLGAAVARNRGDKASALEVTERLRSAAASGLAGSKNASVGKEPERELARERSKSFDIGL